MLNYDHSSKQPEDISHGSWKQISTQKSNSVCFDRLGKYCAVHVDFGTIDLWDTSATPVPMSSLKYSFLGDGFVCNNINWSHNAHYVVCTFFYKNSSKESVTNDRCILVYEVATLQLIRHFKVPFTVVTTCFLPFNDDNCLLLGTAEVEQFFLLDMLSNTLRPLLIHDNSPTASEMDPSISDLSVSVGGEASMIFLSNALLNSCDTTEHNPKLLDFWREVLSQNANSSLSGVAQSMVRVSSSAALVADVHCADVSSEASCALYLVLNGATGAASKLCKLSLLQSTFANEGRLSLRLVNWVRLWGFGSRVSAITPNTSGSLLVLEASLTLAVQVFSTNLSQSEGSEGLVAFHSAPLHGQAYRSASSQQNTRQQAFSHVKADQMLDCKGVGFVRHNSKGSAKTSSDEWLVVAVQASPADVAITNKLVFCALDDAWVSECAPDTHQQGSYSLPLPRSGVLQFSAKPTCDSDGFGASSINSLLATPALLMCVDRTHRLFSQSWHLASSDFPGPMYPIGYQLVKQCVTYIEAEAELDRVVSPSALHSCSDSPSSCGQSSTSLLLGIAERPREASAVDRSVYLSRLPFSLRDTVHDLRDKAVAGTGSRSVGCKRKRMVRGKMAIETSVASGIGSTVDNSVVDEDTLDVVVRTGTGDRSAGILGGGESSGSDSGEEDEEARARVPQLTSHLFVLPTSSYFATSGSSSSSSSFSTSMLQDVLTVPNKIHTGDYFAKLQRDREMGAALVALTQDGGHVRQSLLRLQTEAVERAVAHEEAKERARLRSKEKSEEKRHKQLEEQRQMLLANTLREQALAEERRKAEQQQFLQQQQHEQHIKEQHAILSGEVHQEEVSNVAFALARHLRERQLSSEIKNEPTHTIVDLPTETETEEGLC